VGQLLSLYEHQVAVQVRGSRVFCLGEGGRDVWSWGGGGEGRRGSARAAVWAGSCALLCFVGSSWGACTWQPVDPPTHPPSHACRVSSGTSTALTSGVWSWARCWHRRWVPGRAGGQHSPEGAAGSRGWWESCTPVALWGGGVSAACCSCMLSLVMAGCWQPNCAALGSGQALIRSAASSLPPRGCSTQHGAPVATAVEEGGRSSLPRCGWWARR
jgi:hypothetical protein